MLSRRVITCLWFHSPCALLNWPQRRRDPLLSASRICRLGSLASRVSELETKASSASSPAFRDLSNRFQTDPRAVAAIRYSCGEQC
jgi:hypothetical protein